VNKAEKGWDECALAVQGLSYGFTEDKLLFDGLDLTIATGEFVALLAPSGIGKTTLFRLLAGQLEPLAGELYIGAEKAERAEKTENAERAERAERAKRAERAERAERAGSTERAKKTEKVAMAGSKLSRIGYMPQRDCLMPWRTVLDNAALGLELSGFNKREARRRALELLPQFGLSGTENQYPHELSGGMRQRVSFLRSILGGSSVLLLDEPFSALDAMVRIQMQEWLLQVWEQHRKTILFITHDIDEAILLADRVLVTASSPVSVLHEIVIDLPRPRSYDIVLDPPFIALKRRAMEQLGRGSRQRKSNTSQNRECTELIGMH